MIRYCKFLVLFLFSFTTSDRNLSGQKVSDLAPEMVIDEFIRKTGGEKWRNLKSRKEYAFVEYEEDKNSILPTLSHDRIKINVQPEKSIEVHKVSGDLSSLLVYKPDCNWYYSNRSQVVKFFGPEPVKFKNTLPRTELLEILNLEPMKTVYIEDTLYRVDYKDMRQLDGKHSLFFGMNSGLLYKRGYTSKNEVRWEFHFSNYTESQGFFEPHQIKLTSNGNSFLNIAIKSIQYNIEIDANIFTPPIPCKNEDHFKHLEFPYTPDVY
jgi:hypothetical protein